MNDNDTPADAEHADVKRLECLTRIARRYLCIETLQPRNSDALDFHSVGIWQVEKALRAAYKAGRDSTRPPRPDRPPT